MNTEDLMSIVARWKTALAKIDELEASMKIAKEAERKLREEDVPAAMEELNVKSLTLHDTGEKLRVADDVYAAMPTAGCSTTGSEV